jgi:SAM-dependent methyltransferase
MHASVQQFAADTLGDHEPFEYVVAIGSLDVNGDVRHLIPHKEWTGIDIVDGPGVDIVANAHDLTEHFADGCADLVVCVEQLEHDSHPANTFAEIRRILAPGGILLLTTRAHGFVHHHPPDYFRFTDEDLCYLAITGDLRWPWTPSEALDPVTTPAPPIVGEHPPLAVISLDPDPQYQHPGWLMVATAT